MDFDEIFSLIADTKKDLYNDLGETAKAEHFNLQAARHDLNGALRSAKAGDFKTALRLFTKIQNALQDSHLLQSEWAEIYVAQAICYGRLGRKREMAMVWKRASALEPDNEKLKRIAQRLELI